MLKIIKNRPIPLKKCQLRGSRYDIMDEMEVGDCVIAKNRSQANAMTMHVTVPKAGRPKSSKRFVTREQDDGTVAVWRFE